MRAADQDEPRLEVHVRLAQREELALAHPGVDRRREEILPLRRQRGEKRRHLRRAQVVGQSLDDLPLRHVSHGVRPREPLHPARHRERPAQVAAEVVHAPRTEDALLPRQEEIDLPRRHVGEQRRPERRADDVPADARCAGVRSCLGQELPNPPLHQLVHRAPAALDLHRLEAEALPLVAGLEIERQSLGGRLVGCRRGD